MAAESASEGELGRSGQARTRLARGAVVAAAQTLFVERGYAATTMDAISGLADVPPATVYRLFSSKLGILKALLDASVAGAGDAVPLVEQAPAQALLAEPDPVRQLEGFAAICREVNARTAPLYRVLVGAAESDSSAADLLAHQTRERRAGQRLIARSLARAGALRPGVTQRDAADIIHALMSPEMFRLLVVDCGWRPGKYERWLARSLVDQLLPR